MTSNESKPSLASDNCSDSCDRATWRVLDANLNRAVEGLRVIEDYVRFARNDSHLSQRAKALRHQLANTLRNEGVRAAELHQARETEGDVGAEISAHDEYDRESPIVMLEANFQRVQQSVRCLEEYSKLFSPSAASRFESLRYECYTLGRAVFIAEDSTKKLVDSRLYLIVDASLPQDTWAERMRLLVQAGADVIQLRDKTLSDHELLIRARLLRDITLHSNTLFVMNDRPDLARLSKADGVHVGQDELQVHDVRDIVGTEMLIGVSTHSLPDARKAVLNGANYIGVGPVFESNTKQFASHVGTKLLRDVQSEIALPAFAIGGIDLNNVHQVTEAGFTRVAVSGAVRDTQDSSLVIKHLKKHLSDELMQVSKAVS